MCNGNDYISKVMVMEMITFQKLCNGNRNEEIAM